jgi:hypothetical protein
MKKDIMGPARYGDIGVSILCFLFIVFQCHTANHEVSY